MFVRRPVVQALRGARERGPVDAHAPTNDRCPSARVGVRLRRGRPVEPRERPTDELRPHPGAETGRDRGLHDAGLRNLREPGPERARPGRDLVPHSGRLAGVRLARPGVYLLEPDGGDPRLLRDRQGRHRGDGRAVRRLHRPWWRGRRHGRLGGHVQEERWPGVLEVRLRHYARDRGRGTPTRSAPVRPRPARFPQTKPQARRIHSPRASSSPSRPSCRARRFPSARQRGRRRIQAVRPQWRARLRSRS